MVSPNKLESYRRGLGRNIKDRCDTIVVDSTRHSLTRVTYMSRKLSPASYLRGTIKNTWPRYQQSIVPVRLKLDYPSARVCVTPLLALNTPRLGAPRAPRTNGTLRNVRNMLRVAVGELLHVTLNTETVLMVVPPGKSSPPYISATVPIGQLRPTLTNVRSPVTSLLNRVKSRLSVELKLETRAPRSRLIVT